MSHIALPLNELYAPIEGGLARVVAVFDRELRSELAFVNELTERVKAYRGKMLRPALLLLAGEACGGVTAEHDTLGAVVEMVHLATLVHDDVLDEADVRRRQPTINALQGNEAAVLLGDYLISHAFHLCSSLDSQYASRLIGSTTNTVCEGELLQIQHRGCYALTEETYFEIIRRKTAALTGASCTLGARYAGAGPRAVAAAGDFGINAGMAFQIVDDVLDLVGVERVVGKTLGRDLDLGKLTLPFIHYLGQAAPADRASLIGLSQRRETDARREVARRLKGAGSIAYALDTAETYVRQALSDLDHLPDGPARASLAALAEFILRRDV